MADIWNLGFTVKDRTGLKKHGKQLKNEWRNRKLVIFLWEHGYGKLQTVTDHGVVSLVNFVLESGFIAEVLLTWKLLNLDVYIIHQIKMYQYQLF